MSRIGDALKRAGAPDITDGLLDMPLAAQPRRHFSHVAVEPEAVIPRGAARRRPSHRRIRARSRSVADATAPTFNGAPVRADSRLVVNPDLPAFAVEQYRRLAATLHHIQEDRGVKRVIVSSAVAEEGRR